MKETRKFIVVAMAVLALSSIYTSCKKTLGSTKVEIIDSVRHYLPIVLGDDVNMVWEIKNIGQENLVIKDIQPSNGSIELKSIETALIPPGGTQKILFVFHSSKNVGYAEHKIRIFGNIEPDGVAIMKFDINIVRPTLDRTDYEEIFFDNENRVESEAFNKGHLNRAYYTDADSLDYMDIPEPEDSTQRYRQVREQYLQEQEAKKKEKKEKKEEDVDMFASGEPIDFATFKTGSIDNNTRYVDIVVFRIRQTQIPDNSKIDDIVIWSNEHPSKSIILRTYSDKETGNTKLNQELSKQRIQEMKELLIRKGVDPNKIKEALFSDTVQPFKQSEYNRCIIVEIK